MLADVKPANTSTIEKLTSMAVIKQKKPNKKAREWHLFSPALAKQINPRRPDIAGSIILYGLSLWLKNHAPYTWKDNRRWCHRSLSQLALEDHPYFSKTGIEKALRRAEKALNGCFIVERSGKYGKGIWFSMSSQLLALIAKDKNIIFAINDAHYGIPESVIKANLEYQVMNFEDPKTDLAGNRYARLSPSALEKVLPFTRHTIMRAIKNLLTKYSLITPHPKSFNFYASHMSYEGPFPENAKVAKVETPVAKEDTTVATVDDFIGTSSIQILIHDSKALYYDASPPEAESIVDSLTCYVGNNVSEAGKMMVRDISKSWGNKLAQLRLKKKQAYAFTLNSDDDVLPYMSYSNELLGSGLIVDLPYDEIIYHHDSVKGYTGKLESEYQIDEMISSIKMVFDSAQFKYTKKDMKMLRQFFNDNPQFDDENWDEIMEAITPLSTRDNIRLRGGYGPKPTKGSYDHYWFARQCKDLTYLLNYLPLIVQEMFSEVSFDSNGEKDPFCDMPEPFESLDYSYIGEFPKSWKNAGLWKVESEVVTHEQNPMVSYQE